MGRIPLQRGLVAAALAAGTLAAAAVAAPKPDAPHVTLEHIRVMPGETLVVHGRGFPDEMRVSLRIGRPDGSAERVGAARAGQNGRFVAHVSIDPEVSPGRYVIVACRNRCKLKASTGFRILKP
jgi:hypothetical protein